MNCTRCSDRTAMINNGYCEKCLIKVNSVKHWRETATTLKATNKEGE